MLLILSIVLLFNACRKEVDNEFFDSDVLSVLENGDLICRLGNGFFSDKFKEYSSSEKVYSHVGIVEYANDSFFVIHAEANELTGIGYVKRESVSDFLKDIKTWGIYRFDTVSQIRDNIAANAKKYYTNKTPFDLDFNCKDDSKVYCTELVALAINNAFDSITIVPQLSFAGRKFYGVDNTYKLSNVKQIRRKG